MATKVLKFISVSLAISIAHRQSHVKNVLNSLLRVLCEDIVESLASIKMLILLVANVLA